MSGGQYSRLGPMLLLAVAAMPGFLLAGPIHVAPGGRDGSDGSTSADPTTFRSACSRARAGDVILVRAGRYTSTQDACQLGASGEPGKPILIRGIEAMGLPVVQRPQGWARITGSWVTIERMSCEDAGGACVVVDGASHVTVRDLVVRRSWRALDVRRTTDSLFERVVVEGAREGIYIRQASHRNVIRMGEFYEVGAVESGGDRCAICVGEAAAGRDNRIERNLVVGGGSRHSDYAITVYDAPGTVIAGNVIMRFRSGGIMVTQRSVGSTVTDNVVEDSGYCGPGWSNVSGITVRNASNNAVVSGNRIVRQTVCPGNRWGDASPRGAIDIRGWRDPGRALIGVTLRRNIVEGTIGGPDIQVDPYSLVEKLVIQ